MVHPRYEYTYDKYGNQTSIRDNIVQVDPTDEDTIYYDHDGIAGDDTRVTQFAHNEFGQQVARTLPLGVQNGSGFVETSSYNDNGQLELSIDFAGRHTVFTYDTLGRLETKEYFPDAATWNNGTGTPTETVSYTYNSLGGLEDTDDSANGLTNNTYDAQGRLTQVISPEGIVNYEYDPVSGRLERTYTGTADPDETSIASDGKAVTDTRYEYDILGRLSKVSVHERNDTPLDTPEDTLYTYDLLGNLDTVTLSSGVVSDYIYDELGRLTELTHFEPEDGSGDPNSYEDNDVLGMFEYELLLDGRRAGVDETDDLGQVTQIDWFYDNLGRLTGEAYDSHDDSLDFIDEYRFDLVGNRLQKLTHNQPMAAELDAYLTDRTFTPDEAIDYEYDANDRLLVEELDTGADGTIEKTTLYEYGPNADFTDPADPYGGDHTEQTKKTVWQGTDTDPATGTKDSETTFGYNLQGRLASSTVDKTGSGGSVTNTSYTYNDSGIRTSQTVDAQTTEYVIDSNNLTGYAQVLEEHVAGQITRSYTIGHDLISQADDPATVYHFLYDGHGSTRALLDAAGAIVADQVFNYDAYGNAVGFNAATALTTILYCGEQFDIATDQLYLRTRYYDAAMGRLNRDDDFTGDPGAPQSLHKYLYTHADPVNGIDPTGLWSLGSTMTSIGIQAGLTALFNYTVTNVVIGNIIAGEKSGMPDGLMLNVGASAATTGVVGSGSLNLYIDFATMTPHLYWTAEFGSAPVARFSTQRGFGWSASIGPVWNVDDPDRDLTGYSAIATTPAALYFHSTNVSSAGSWWSAMMYLARVSKGGISGRSGSFQAVQSLSRDTVGLFFGLRQYSFSATVGYTRRLASLSDLPAELRQKLRSVTHSISVFADSLDDPQKLPYFFSQITAIFE